MLLKAEVSKVDYSSKAKSCNVRDLLVTKNTVHTCVHEAVTCVYELDLLRLIVYGTRVCTRAILPGYSSKLYVLHYLFETYAYRALQYIATL